MTTARLILVEQNAVSLGGHYYAYTRSLAQAAQEAGLAVTVLENRALGEDWGPNVQAIPAFDKTRFDSDAVEIRPWRPGNIAFDVSCAMRNVPVREGDRILFPTLDFGECLQLLHWVSDDSSLVERRIAHLLLRYDPGALSANVALFRPYFDRIGRSALLRSRVLLHTDTDALSRELEHLSGLNVTTLPVTFDQAPLRTRLGRGSAASDHLTAIYLGDARREKNYQALPDAVAHLWARYVKPGRLRFVVQSNFNIAGGEPGILDAAQRLGQYPPDRVRILPAPLSVDQYQNELAGADIVLLPYDADRYRLRSSGILIEAVAAGKPVVTTASSWMAGEVDARHAVVIEGPEELGPAIATLVDDFPRFRSAASAVAPETLERSSGRAFIRALLERGVPREPQGRRILFTVDAGDLARGRSSGEIVLARAKAVAVAGLQAVLVLVDAEGERAGNSAIPAARRRAAEIDVDVLVAEPEPDAVYGSASEGVTLAGLAHRCGALRLGNEDAAALRAAPVDAVWVSRASHVELVRALGLADRPLVGAVDDFDSFRVAIEQGRIVSAEDVETEATLLGACAHLVAASSDLAEDWRRSLPDKPLTVVPIALDAGPSIAAMIAGSRDLADVALRAGLHLAPDDGFPGGRISRSKLANLAGLDLVVVVGDDPASRAGARWFVHEVYAPYLVGLGFSLLVANAPDDVASIQLDSLLTAGPCEWAGPLYAAARLVVAPASDLARATPEVWDAVAHGAPVVATSAALRGMPSDRDGVVAADKPVDLAARIIELLSSETARRDLIASGRRSRVDRAARAQARDNLHRVLNVLLGERPHQQLSPEDRSVEEPLIIEWGPLVAAVNGLVGAWQAGRPLDETALQTLTGFALTDIGNLVRIVVGVAGGGGRSSEQRGDAVILTALGRLDRDGDAPTHTGDEPVAISYYSGLPLQIVAMSAEEPSGREPPVAGAHPDPMGDAPNQRRWRVLADRDQDARLASVSVQGHRALILSQWLAFPTRETHVLGQPLVDADWDLRRDGPALVLHDGEAIGLNWPAILTTAPSRTWLEVWTNETAELCIDDHGKDLAVARSHADSLAVHRVRLDMPACGLATLRIASVSGSAALFRARLCVILGADAGMEPELLDAVRDPVSPEEAGRIALTLATLELKAGRAFGDVVRASYAGSPVRGSIVPRMRARLRQTMSEGMEPLDALRSILSGLDLGPGGWSHGAMAATLAALLPDRAIGPEPLSYVASPGLSAEISAAFASEVEADAATCLQDGEASAGLPYEGAVRRWCRPGRHPARGSSWVHSVAFADMNGVPVTPLSIGLVFRLPAALDPVTGEAYVDRLGFHATEYDGGRPAYAWTGPRPTSRITLPVAPARPGRIVFAHINSGSNQSQDDFGVFMNDRRLPHEVRGKQIVAAFEADPDAPALMDIRLTVAHMHSSPTDPRELGLALSSIVVEFLMRRSDEAPVDY